MMWIKCYVCNTATGDWGNNLAGLKSQHSNVLITDLLKKVLNGFQSMRNIDNQWNRVCIDCLNKIENYDWNRLRANQAEWELYNILVQTENGFMVDSESVLIEGTASTSNLRTENDATVDTQSLIEPEMISVNEMFDVKMETHMSYEEIDETNEELFVPTIGTPLQVCNPIDFDESIEVPEYELGVNVECSVGWPRGSSEMNNDCNECGMVFERRDDLHAHNKHVHGRTPGRPKKFPAIEPKVKRPVGRPRGSTIYECTECDTVFERMEDLRVHNKHVHKRTPARPNKCPVKVEPKVKRPVGRPRRSTSYECTECDVVFGRMEDLRAHNEHVHGQTPARPKKCPVKIEPKVKRPVGRPKRSTSYECTECDVVFGRMEDLRAHNEHVHGQTPARPKKYPVKIEPKVKRPVGRPRRSTSYECTKCDIVFGGMEDFRAHNKHLHLRAPRRPKKIPAETEPKVKYPVGRPRGSTSYECTECDIVFERIDDKRTHNKHVHKRTRGRPRKFPANEPKVERSAAPKKTEAVVVYGVTSCVDSSSIQVENTDALKTEDVDEAEIYNVGESYGDRLAIKDEPDFNNGDQVFWV